LDKWAWVAFSRECIGGWAVEGSGGNAKGVAGGFGMVGRDGGMGRFGAGRDDEDEEELEEEGGGFLEMVLRQGKESSHLLFSRPISLRMRTAR
jgi:hypothetical protein